MRKLIPVVRRVLGEVNDLTLSLRTNYAMVLYKDPAATLDDVREAVNELEDTERTARQVLSGTHPLTTGFEGNLRRARELLRAREDGKKIIFV